MRYIHYIHHTYIHIHYTLYIYEYTYVHICKMYMYTYNSRKKIKTFFFEIIYTYIFNIYICAKREYSTNI